MSRQAARADSQPGPPQLTRRGRLVIALCAAVIASLAGLALAASASATDHGQRPGGPGGSMARVIVQPGQTLWSIAVQAEPRSDPRLVIRQIIAANGLTADSLTAGQRLWVPRG